MDFGLTNENFIVIPTPPPNRTWKTEDVYFYLLFHDGTPKKFWTKQTRNVAQPGAAFGYITKPSSALSYHHLGFWRKKSNTFSFTIFIPS